MFLEVFSLAWRALWERRGRTVGAIVGVVIAFTALSFALLLGHTFRYYVTQFFTSAFQLNALYVLGVEFTDTDVFAMSAISGVDLVVPIAAAQASVVLPGAPQRTVVTLYGVPSYVLYRVFPQSALREGASVLGPNLALVGYYIAYDSSTGLQRLGVGSPVAVTVGDKSATFVVMGVLALGSMGVLDTARGMYVDIETFRALTGTRHYAMLVVYAKDASMVRRVEGEIRARYPNAQIFSPQTVLESVNAFFTQFQLFLGLISGVSTLITALWLYDTMTISTMQRTKEIGVLRAVGFKRRQVTAMFLTEALIVAVIGVALGVPILLAVGYVAQVVASAFLGPGGLIIDPLVLAGAAALVILVNLTGALLPAYRAGRVEVVNALRYE